MFVFYQLFKICLESISIFQTGNIRDRLWQYNQISSAEDYLHEEKVMTV